MRRIFVILLFALVTFLMYPAGQVQATGGTMAIVSYPKTISLGGQGNVVSKFTNTGSDTIQVSQCTLGSLNQRLEDMQNGPALNHVSVYITTPSGARVNAIGEYGALGMEGIWLDSPVDVASGQTLTVTSVVKPSSDNKNGDTIRVVTDCRAGTAANVVQSGAVIVTIGVKTEVTSTVKPSIKATVAPTVSAPKDYKKVDDGIENDKNIKNKADETESEKPKKMNLIESIVNFIRNLFRKAN